MAFNSFIFFIFFLCFFGLYWAAFKSTLRGQNFLLLAGSYFFYAWTDWRFLSFLAGVSLLNFLLGIQMEKATSRSRKRLWLYIGLLQGIGGLLFFKYYNFFALSFHNALNSFGFHSSLWTFSIIAPVGISFYSFRTLSYLLDIYKGKIPATRDWLAFFNYISFFPCILSGPIDRAGDFIPQLEKKRNFDYAEARSGLKQILWGLFKKIVVADNCARVTDHIFDHYHSLFGSTLLLGAFLYTMQVYADFSGYSDMATGFSRLLGFRAAMNFNFPFFAQNIADFWQRWHISLTTWITEYVYTPLSIAFRYYGKAGMIIAILVNFTIVGIWHGAKWTNILYGFVHGCYFIPLILAGTMNKRKKFSSAGFFPGPVVLMKMLLTFGVIMFTFVIFRSTSIRDAIHFYGHLLTRPLFSLPQLGEMRLTAIIAIVFIVAMILIEWVGRLQPYAIAELGMRWHRPIRWMMYYSLTLCVLYFSGGQQVFIYSQF